MSTTTFPAGLSEAKKQFVTNFYATSDRPEAVDEYVALLTDSVDFIMGLNPAKGGAAVRKIRQTMWSGITTRHHQPRQVYADGTAEADELMIHGTVDYGLANGSEVDGVGWAALMVFVPGAGEELKLSKYQVWLDSSALVDALKN